MKNIVIDDLLEEPKNCIWYIIDEYMVRTHIKRPIPRYTSKCLKCKYDPKCTEYKPVGDDINAS